MAHLHNDLIEGRVDGRAQVRSGDVAGYVNGGGPGGAHGVAAEIEACLPGPWFNQVGGRHAKGEGDHSGMTSRVAT